MVGSRVLAIVLAGLLTAALGPSAVGQPTMPRAELAFLHDFRLWMMDSDGGNPHRVLKGEVLEPAWSPDGSLIAFSRSRRWDRGDIWVTSPSGSDPRIVVRGGRGALAYPVWSPDGSRLAYMRYGPRRTTLETASLDGTARKVVKRFKERGNYEWSGEPAWSPDGDTLLYTLQAYGRVRYRFSIHRLNLDGSGDRRLIRDASGPAFSPDGRWLAYSDASAHKHERCGDEDPCAWNGDLAVANADGSNGHAVLVTRTHEHQFSWSADSSRIAFASARNYSRLEERPEIYTITREGSCLTWLTNGNVDSDRPVWSPTPGETAPSQCGLHDRAPLVESLPRHRAGLWLGETFDGVMYTGRAERRDGSVYTFYRDCAAYEPGDCKRPFDIEEMNACRPSGWLRYALRHRQRVRRIGSALVVRWADAEFTIFKGHSGVALIRHYFSPETPERRARIARTLQPVSGGALPHLAMHPRLRALLPKRLRRTVATCH